MGWIFIISPVIITSYIIRLGREQLALLPKDSVLVNDARGPILDLDALYDLLRDGHIAAAGLDVLPQEPPVEPIPKLLAAYRASGKDRIPLTAAPGQAMIARGAVRSRDFFLPASVGSRAPAPACATSGHLDAAVSVAGRCRSCSALLARLLATGGDLSTSAQRVFGKRHASPASTPLDNRAPRSSARGRNPRQDSPAHQSRQLNRVPRAVRSSRRRRNSA